MAKCKALTGSAVKGLIGGWIGYEACNGPARWALIPASQHVDGSFCYSAVHRYTHADALLCQKFTLGKVQLNVDACAESNVFTRRFYTVSQKTVQICFCLNFIKFPPILIIFGIKMAKRLKLCEMYSLSTSTNLRHHTTVLNADMPNCYGVHCTCYFSSVWFLLSYSLEVVTCIWNTRVMKMSVRRKKTVTFLFSHDIYAECGPIFNNLTVMTRVLTLVLLICFLHTHYANGVKYPQGYL